LARGGAAVRPAGSNCCWLAPGFTGPLKKFAAESRQAGAAEAHAHELDVAETTAWKFLWPVDRKNRKFGIWKSKFGTSSSTTPAALMAVYTFVLGLYADWDAMLHSKRARLLRLSFSSLAASGARCGREHP